MGCSFDVGVIDNTYLTENYETSAEFDVRIIDERDLEKLSSADQTSLVAVLRPDCKYCVSFVPQLVQTINKREDLNVYFLPTEDLSDEAIEHPDQVEETLECALSNGKFTLIECIVSNEERVYPVACPTCGLNKMNYLDDVEIVCE